MRLILWCCFNKVTPAIACRSRENSRHFATPNHWFPREMTSEKRLQIQIYQDMDIAFDCLGQIFPRASTNQKHYPDWVVTRQQYGISAVVPILSRQSFRDEISGSVAICRLFSHNSLASYVDYLVNSL